MHTVNNQIDAIRTSKAARGTDHRTHGKKLTTRQALTTKTIGAMHKHAQPAAWVLVALSPFLDLITR